MAKEIISGVYKIVNLINNKIYVGSSIDIHYRWRKHRECLNRNKHENQYLQNSWNKYGENNFKFEIISTIDKKNFSKKELLDLEQYYINNTNCTNRSLGYNIRIIADSPFGLVFSEARKELYRTNSKTKKAILQFDLSGNLIKEWSSAKEVSKKEKYSISAIVGCLKRKDKMYTSYNYIWIYKTEFKENGIDLQYYLNGSSKYNKIVQLDKNYNLIKIWDNMKEPSEKLNIRISNINNVCIKNHITAGGYVWMYLFDYENNLNKLDKFNPKKTKNINIIQLSLSGEHIKLWESLTIASNNLNINISCISECLKGKQLTSGGFKWIYSDDYKN